MKVHTGVIVGITHGSKGVRIILDGSKKPITLHESYIELSTDRHRTYKIGLDQAMDEPPTGWLPS